MPKTAAGLSEVGADGRPCSLSLGVGGLLVERDVLALAF